MYILKDSWSFDFVLVNLINLLNTFRLEVQTAYAAVEKKSSGDFNTTQTDQTSSYKVHPYALHVCPYLTLEVLRHQPNSLYFILLTSARLNGIPGKIKIAFHKDNVELLSVLILLPGNTSVSLNKLYKFMVERSVNDCDNRTSMFRSCIALSIGC